MLVDHNTDAGPHFSYIEFGDYNTASMRNVNDMTWLPNTAGSYWGNSITGFKYGAHSNTSRFSTTAQSWGAQTARLSSGWYDIVGPTAQIDAIRQSICAEAGIITNCNIGTTGQTEFACGANKSLVPTLPSFFLEFGNYWFEVQPEDYIQLVSEGSCNCILRLVADDDIGGVGTANTWNLGLAFMQGYYTVHQY